MQARVLEAETLDHLAPDDPSAERSRRDLRRINRIMGARRVLERAIARALPSSPVGRRLRVTELGAGDGSLLLEVARGWPATRPSVDLALLDRQPIVDAETIAAYGAAGWRARPLTMDVVDWMREPAPERDDLVVANLFLHHFDDPTLARLLAAIAGRADALVAVEPRRSGFALLASRLVGFVGANAVTRRDAVLSVRAGFAGRELATLWPSATGFDVDERDDGLFSHVLTARRG